MQDQRRQSHSSICIPHTHARVRYVSRIFTCVVSVYFYLLITLVTGRVVSGYKVTRVNRKDEWKLIGKQDPQLPQMFYPVANNLTLTRGDTVVSFTLFEQAAAQVTKYNFICLRLLVVPWLAIGTG